MTECSRASTRCGAAGHSLKDFRKVQSTWWLCRLCPEQPTSFDSALGVTQGVLRQHPRAIFNMAYQCVATSLDGFIQQLAVSYLAHGYWFYVTGRIPESKDPRLVDRKLTERYGINVSKWTRSRRRKIGIASVQYLRHDR